MRGGTHGGEGRRGGAALDFEISMAFQPIIDAARERVWGYEALVRGADGAPAGEILAQVDDESRCAFDQACRVKAIEMAAELFPPGDAKLCINFMPSAVIEPGAYVSTSVAAADRAGFERDRIIFELTERERVGDTGRIARIVAEHRQQGFLTAIDDFGAGQSDLSLLAKFQPDIVKLDIGLVRGIEGSRSQQVIVAGLSWTVRTLGVDIVAEGVEKEVEYRVLRAAGIRLFQGYYFAGPAFEALPDVPLGRLPGLQALSA